MTNVSATRYVGDLKGGNISRWQNTKMNVFTADDRYLYEWMFPKLEDPEEGGYLRVLDGAGEVVARWQPAGGGSGLYVPPGTPGGRARLYCLQGQRQAVLLPEIRYRDGSNPSQAAH